MNRRQLVLLALLVATLAATWWASTIDDRGGDAAVVRVARVAGESTAGRARDGRERKADGAVPRIDRAAWPSSAARLMEPPNIREAGPIAPPQLPLVPPPLPFRFVGAIEDGGRRTAILMEGEQVLLVRARQRIDTRYRVEHVSAASIEITYLPLARKQVLELGGGPGNGG